MAAAFERQVGDRARAVIESVSIVARHSCDHRLAYGRFFARGAMTVLTGVKANPDKANGRRAATTVRSPTRIDADCEAGVVCGGDRPPVDPPRQAPVGSALDCFSEP